MLLFVGGWCAVCSIIAAFGGWRRLSRFYAAGVDAPRGGVRLSSLHGTVGALGQYNGVLNATVSNAGIRLEVMVLFRAGHPPLFLPWSRVHSIRHASSFFKRGISFQVELGARSANAAPRFAKVRLYGRDIGAHVEQALRPVG